MARLGNPRLNQFLPGDLEQLKIIRRCRVQKTSAWVSGRQRRNVPIL